MLLAPGSIAPVFANAQRPERNIQRVRVTRLNRSTRGAFQLPAIGRDDRVCVPHASSESRDANAPGSHKPTTRSDPLLAASHFRQNVKGREADTLGLNGAKLTTNAMNAKPNAKVFAAMVLALAGVFANLSVPTAAHAAKTQAAQSSSSTKTVNPNLIQLDSTTRGKLDTFFLKRVQDCREVLVSVDQHINDPWEIEDAWLIVAWHFLISKGRRKVFNLTREKHEQNETKVDEVWNLAADTEAWDFSFLKLFIQSCEGFLIIPIRRTRPIHPPDCSRYKRLTYISKILKWLKKPMQAVGALWITLYIFDNAVRVGSLLEMARWLPNTTLNQFDRGMYTLTGGIISVMAADRWFPDFLKTKANISDASQRLVLTRLLTVGLFMTTIASSAVVFGLPPNSLLGFGGIGGLTFGLAAKDLVSNFIGGSMLAIVRPFSPGEKVYLMAVGGRFRGTNEPSVGGYLVKDIGWYQTTLIPKDTRPTTVPNGFFLGANVINISRQTARVVIMNIRVRLDDLNVIDQMTQEVTDYLMKHSAIVKPPRRPIRVHLRDIKPDHANVRVEAHSHLVKKDPFLQANQEITIAVFKIVEKWSTGPAWPVGCYDGMAGSSKYSGGAYTGGVLDIE